MLANDMHQQQESSRCKNIAVIHYLQQMLTVSNTIGKGKDRRGLFDMTISKVT
jgi:hypothetical protein